jgi:hypothetical protein
MAWKRSEIDKRDDQRKRNVRGLKAKITITEQHEFGEAA